jgi:hypothetical protein
LITSPKPAKIARYSSGVQQRAIPQGWRRMPVAVVIYTSCVQAGGWATAAARLPLSRTRGRSTGLSAVCRSTSEQRSSNHGSSAPTLTLASRRPARRAARAGQHGPAPCRYRFRSPRRPSARRTTWTRQSPYAISHQATIGAPAITPNDNAARTAIHAGRRDCCPLHPGSEHASGGALRGDPAAILRVWVGHAPARPATRHD